MTDRIDLAELAREYGVGNLRFFIPMRPIHDLSGFGIPMAYTTDSDDEEMVECIVDEGRYRVEDQYKITLRAVDDLRFSSQSYYQMDFRNLHRRDPDSFRVYVLVDDDNKYHRLH